MVDGERSCQTLLFAGEHGTSPYDGSLKEESRNSSIHDHSLVLNPEFIGFVIIFDGFDCRVFVVVVAHGRVHMFVNPADIE